MLVTRQTLVRFGVSILVAGIIIGPSAFVMHLIRSSAADRNSPARPERHPGGVLQRLSPIGESSSDISISPDGKRIAYFTMTPPFLPLPGWWFGRVRATDDEETPIALPRYLIVGDARGGATSYVPLPGRRIPIGRAAWCPGGRALLVCLSQGTGDEETRDIWRINLDDGTISQMTFGPYESSPAISPDGHWIAFTGNNNMQPYIQAFDEIVRRRIYEAPVTGSTFRWSPDSKRLAFVTMSNREWQRVRPPTMPGGHPGAPPPTTLDDDSVRRRDGRIGLRQVVVVYTLADDSARIVAGPFVNRQVSWSFDGSELFCSARGYQPSGWERWQAASRLFAVKVDGVPEQRWLTPSRHRSISDPVQITPQVVAYLGDTEIFCVPLSGGEPVKATEDALAGSESIVKAPDGSTLLFTRGQSSDYAALDSRVCRFEFSTEVLNRVGGQGAAGTE